MANVSMKFILLLATVAVLYSMCSGTRLPPRPDFSRPRPGPSFNPRPRPSPLNPRPPRKDRFRREAALEPSTYYEVNDAALLDEIVRQPREAPEEAVYVVETPEYYHNN